MNRHERRRYEMLLRVRDFGTTHRQQFPESSEAGKALAAVGDAAAQIEVHAKAKLLTKEEGRQARAAVRAAIEERLKLVARTARMVARTTPGADSRFKYPAQKSGVALVTAARAFIDEGPTAVQRFVPFGMPATIIAELQALVDRYGEADRERRAGKTGFAAARAGTKTALARATQALRVLDVVVPNTLVADAALSAAWHEARRVEASAKAAPAVVTPSVPMTESRTTEPVSRSDGEVAPAPDAATGDATTSPAEAEPALRRVS